MVIFRKKLPGTSELALARFVTRAQRAAGLHGRVNVVVTTSRELRGLNRRFRGKDYPTDVLSFPSISTPAGILAGDIAICADIAAENARQLGHPAGDELKILALHGLLHLAGYDHERDNGKMASTETRLRRALKLPDALIARATGATSGAKAPTPSSANNGAAKAAPLRKKRSAGAAPSLAKLRRTP